MRSEECEGQFAGPVTLTASATTGYVHQEGQEQHCTTKTESGTVSFTTSSVHATLSRHGAVYAIGSAASVRGHLSLRLTPLRSLRPGKYTLTLLSGAGKHETIRSESFMLS